MDMKAQDDPTISKKASELWRFTVRCTRTHPDQHIYRYFSTQEAGIKFMNEECSEDAQRLKVEQNNANPHFGMCGNPLLLDLDDCCDYLGNWGMDMVIEMRPPYPCASSHRDALEEFQSNPEYRAKVLERVQAIKKGREEHKRGRAFTPEEAEHFSRQGRASKWARR